MPKIVSEEEKALIKQALQQKGIALIKEKGLKHITVDDLVNAVGIAKGTFYSYYKTKEELLYEIFTNAESRMLDTILSLQFDNENFKQNVATALKDIYLAPESIALYIQQEDIEFLMRKLPGKAREWQNEKSQNNFKHTAEIFKIDSNDLMTYGVLADLMDSLQALASRKSNYGGSSRQKSLEILVETIADFLDKRRK